MWSACCGFRCGWLSFGPATWTTGPRNRVPVAQLVRRTLRDIEPHARELGSERELEGVREILARGNGADRQRRTFNANRDIVEVAREIADATEAAATAVAAA